jgi:hypothetical protein
MRNSIHKKNVECSLVNVKWNEKKASSKGIFHEKEYDW